LSVEAYSRITNVLHCTCQRRGQHQYIDGICNHISFSYSSLCIPYTICILKQYTNAFVSPRNHSHQNGSRGCHLTGASPLQLLSLLFEVMLRGLGCMSGGWANRVRVLETFLFIVDQRLPHMGFTLINGMSINPNSDRNSERNRNQGNFMARVEPDILQGVRPSISLNLDRLRKEKFLGSFLPLVENSRAHPSTSRQPGTEHRGMVHRRVEGRAERAQGIEWSSITSHSTLSHKRIFRTRLISSQSSFF
jgi:hypothetical protein